MAKILTLTNGTMGDILPYIALGQVLQQRGHQIHMVSPEYMHSHIKAARLNAILGSHQDASPEKFREKALLWDGWITEPQEIAAKQKLDLQYHGREKWLKLTQCINHLLEHYYDVDAIVCNPQEEFTAAIIAEKLAVPLVKLVVTPKLIYQPNNTWRLSRWVKFNNREPGPYQKYRCFLGLNDSESWKDYWQYDRLIFAASPYLYQNPPDVPPANHVGFFFYQHPDWNRWQPSRELKKFVESEPRLLVLSFSSQPMRNAKELVAIHTRAAAILDCKILIQRGLAELDRSHLPTDLKSDRVMFVDFIPQEWLFSQAAAVITHGGIGTVARSLLHGCPLLVEPNTHEQCFNAHQVLRWEVGAAVHPKKITPEGIARVLEKKVLTPQYKRHAENIKNHLQQENGLEKAAYLIETWL